MMASFEYNGIEYTGVEYDNTQKHFYANGKKIEIHERRDGQPGCTISWLDNNQLQSIDLDENCMIFGGYSDNITEPKATSSDITINGGTVSCIFGGNLAGDVNDVKITIDGGNITTGVWGGSHDTGNVVGNVEIVINGGTIGDSEVTGANVVNVSSVNPNATTNKSTIKINTANNPVINGGVSKANKVLINDKVVDLSTIYLDESITTSDAANNKFIGINVFNSFKYIAENFSTATKRIEVSGKYSSNPQFG